MNPKLLISLIIIVLFCSLNNTYANTYIEKTIDGHKVKLIKYNLASDKFIFKIWINKNWEATWLRELLDENNGISWINWAYLCPKDYKSCNWVDSTINERYIEGEKHWPYTDTWERVVFALDKDNKPFLFQTNKINSDKESEIYTWIANFPLLIKDWESMIEHYWDVWLIDKKMILSMNRNFVCSDKWWKNLYLWYVYNIRLNSLHSVLTDIGCYNAVNLDAWYSSAMIYNSKYIIWPGRDILDWLIIERKWLDTKILRDKLHVVIEKIKTKLKYKPINDKIKYLDKLSTRLNQAREAIYDLNKKDILDENWEKIWFEIYANSVKNLKILYIVNYLEKLIYYTKIRYINENKRKGIDDEPMF